MHFGVSQGFPDTFLVSLGEKVLQINSDKSLTNHKIENNLSSLIYLSFHTIVFFIFQ